MSYAPVILPLITPTVVTRGSGQVASQVIASWDGYSAGHAGDEGYHIVDKCWSFTATPAPGWMLHHFRIISKLEFTPNSTLITQTATIAKVVKNTSVYTSYWYEPVAGYTLDADNRYWLVTAGGASWVPWTTIWTEEMGVLRTSAFEVKAVFVQPDKPIYNSNGKIIYKPSDGRPMFYPVPPVIN